MMRPGACLLALAILASGCFGGGPSSGPDPPQGGGPSTPRPRSSASATFEPDESLRQAGKGAIEGWVHNDYNQSIQGARVVLPGTSNFSTTDDRGRFRIGGLSPGRYPLQIVHEEFPVFQDNVTIEVGKITRLDVTLVYLEEAHPKLLGRPHRHDWWGEDTQFDIMNQDISYGTGEACVGVLLSVRCERARILPRSSDDPNERPSIVFQGTGKISLDMEARGPTLHPFDVEILVPRFGYKRAFTYTGAAKHFEMPVNASMWDPSHFRSSGWEIWLGMNKNTTTAGAYAFVGPLHIKLTVYRGDEPIPVESAHPDRWGDEVNRTVLRKTCDYSYQIVASGYTSGCDVLYLRNSPLPNATVTMGTGKIKITISWENVGGAPFRFGVEYVGANQVYNAYTTQWTRPPSTKDEANRREFLFDVRPDLWDSPYAEKSGWAFGYYPENPVAPAAGVFDGTFTYTVEIFKMT